MLLKQRHKKQRSKNKIQATRILVIIQKVKKIQNSINMTCFLLCIFLW